MVTYRIILFSKWQCILIVTSGIFFLSVNLKTLSSEWFHILYRNHVISLVRPNHMTITYLSMRSPFLSFLVVLEWKRGEIWSYHKRTSGAKILSFSNNMLRCRGVWGCMRKGYWRNWKYRPLRGNISGHMVTSVYHIRSQFLTRWGHISWGVAF